MRRLFKHYSNIELFGVLSHSSFLFFSISVLLSQIAYNMLNIVLIFLIFYLTNSNFSVSILVMTYLMPQIILSFIGGIVADMRNKKSIFIYGNALRALAVIILFFNTRSIFLVYVVSSIISIVTQFYVPAESPMIPYLVKKNHITAANSIFGIGFFGSVLLSYILAGPLITMLGRSGIFLVLAGLFLLSTFFALFLPDVLPERHLKIWEIYSIQKVKVTIERKFMESYGVLRKTTEIAEAFFLLMFSQIIILILAVIVPGYAKGILQLPAENLSVLLFAPAAAGVVISALLITSVLRGVSRKKLMTSGLFISGAALLILPFTSRIISHAYLDPINVFLPSFFKIDILHIVATLAFFAGVANALVFIPSQATIQSAAPIELQSKIYGLLFALIGVFSLIPIIVAGGLADIIGVGTVIVILGVIILLIGVSRLRIVSVVFRNLRQV